VNAVRLHGNRHFADTSLIDRLTVQAGDALEPGTPQASEALARVRDTLRRVYQDDGWTGTRIQAVATRVGPSQVDVLATISEGERLKVEFLDASLQPARPQPRGVPQGAERCVAPRARDLKAWTGVAIGQPYTERTIPDGNRKLTRMLRTLGFSGVRVAASFDPKSRRMNVAARYETCHLLRFFVRDAPQPGREGFKPLADSALLESLPFGDSGVFDATEADLARAQVRQFFESRGHLLADVVLDYRSREATDAAPSTGPAWAPDVAGVMSFLVTLGPRIEIRGIRFPGRHALSDEVLHKAVTTRPYDFFGDPGVLIPDQVVEDLDRLEKTYQDEGFRDFHFDGVKAVAGRVRETSTEGTDTVWSYYAGPERVFRVRRPPHPDGVYLEIPVVEGPRSVLGKVDVHGSKIVGPDDVRRAGLVRGGAFAAPRLADGLSRLQRRLAQSGFLVAEVRATCRGTDPEVPAGDCTAERMASRVVDLSLEVVDGPVTGVGGVFVDGTRRTRDSIVTRDFPAPGDPYDLGKVAEAVRRLKDLGVFSSVQLTAIGADETPPRKDVGLVVATREARSRFLDFGGGFETLNRSLGVPGYFTSPLTTSIALQDRTTTSFGRALGLQIPDVLVTAEARYTDQNFLGTATRLYLPIKYGLSATAWDRYASFTPTYVDPRFFAKGLTFRFTPFGVYDRATTALDLIETGAEFALSKELVKRFYGSVTLEIAGVKSRNPSVTDVYSPFRLETKVIPSLTFDRLDHPINPKKGLFLLGSLAYINALDLVAGSIDNFLKWEVVGKFFVSARNLVTFALYLHYGASMSFGGAARLPDEERFTLGGNRGIRGFGDDAVAQYRPDGSLRLDTVVNDKGVVTRQKPYGGDVVLSATAEMRFPLVPKLGLDAAIFYDIGALAEHMLDLNPASVRQSVGAGLRLLVGGTIPIRLDYGLILGRRCKYVDAVTGACTQIEEIGNIHFGVLYTF
jgi:outer membrane protein assembly factor BamA